MRDIIKKRLWDLGRLIFHAIIPIAIVSIILNVWANSLNNDASMEWNLFVTVACFGSCLLVIAIAFFVEWVAWRYFWSKPFN